MSDNYRELIEHFQRLQPGLCDSLSLAITEALNDEWTLTFSSVLTTNLESARKEFPEQPSVIRFTFEELPVHDQWILLTCNDIAKKELIPCALARYFSFASPSIEILDTLPIDSKTEEMLCSRYRIEKRDDSQNLFWFFDKDVLQKIAEKSAANPVKEIETYNHTKQPSLKERDLELLMDIPLDINVELGRVKLTVQKIIELIPGSVIELEKTAGEPVDVLVNGRLIAKGEVIVVEENFGVRITEILSPHARIGKLSEAA